jgi:hypothetical protein
VDLSVQCTDLIVLDSFTRIRGLQILVCIRNRVAQGPYEKFLANGPLAVPFIFATKIQIV